MPTETVFQTPFRRSPPAELLQAGFAQDLPDIPVLPKTLLCLELMAQGACVDLREMTQLVLGDLGATLQILRLAGREYGDEEGRPVRMEDCIVDLGLEACLKAVSTQMATDDGPHHAIAKFWDHCREIAQQSRLLAEEMPEVNPGEAYLVGLLHAIGLLPKLLGWREPGGADGALAGLRLATRWSLPPCATEFFGEMHRNGYAACWSWVVRKAHQRAKRSRARCPFAQCFRPHLLRDEYEQPEPAGYQ